MNKKEIQTVLLLFALCIPISVGIGVLPIYLRESLEVQTNLSILMMLGNTLFLPCYLLLITKMYKETDRTTLGIAILVSFASLYITIALHYLGWGLAGVDIINPNFWTGIIMMAIVCISSLILIIGTYIMCRDVEIE